MHLLACFEVTCENVCENSALIIVTKRMVGGVSERIFGNVCEWLLLRSLCGRLSLGSLSKIMMISMGERLMVRA